MRKITAEKLLILLSLCLCSLLQSSCSKQNDVRLPVLGDYDARTVRVEKTNLKLGFVSGPYGDMFDEIVVPLLSKKGYSVEYVTYDNYVDPNFALANGQIDLNVFQHYEYLNSFKFEHDLDLSAIAEVPTMPMGVYSNLYSSMALLEEGDAVAIPNDVTNLSRAMVLLKSAGVISVDPGVDVSKLTLNDITGNPKNIKFDTMEAHLLCDALEDYDMVVINGNFAMAGGLKIEDAILTEVLSSHEYINVIAVRTSDLGRKFVMDLIDVLRSQEYIHTIIEQDGEYSRFQLPCNFNSYIN